MDQSSFTSYEALCAELRSIEIWDRNYYRQDNPDRLIRAAYENRQIRREEIIAAILGIKSPENRLDNSESLARAVRET